MNGRLLGWPINRAGKRAEILIYEDIGGGWLDGLTAKAFVEQLNQLGDVTELDVRINSVGGGISDATAMYNALERHPATKTVHIDGIAASAASWIGMVAAPGQLLIAENARVMIHNSWTVEMGDKETFRKAIEQLDKADGVVVDMYMKRAKVSREKIVAMMAAETWMTATEAIEIGLADVLVGPKLTDAANRLDLSNFRNVPKDLSGEARSASGEEEAAAVAVAVAVDARWAEVRGHEAA